MNETWTNERNMNEWMIEVKSYKIVQLERTIEMKSYKIVLLERTITHEFGFFVHERTFCSWTNYFFISFVHVPFIVRSSELWNIPTFGRLYLQVSRVQNFKLNTNIETVCSNSLKWKTSLRFHFECKNAISWVLWFFYRWKNRARLGPVTLI